MEAPSRKIRIGEAGAAIGATPKALRHWISRYSGKGLKPTAEQTGTWLEFSFGDVAALAITKYLVDLGLPAFGAFAVAMGLVQARWPNLFNVDEPSWAIDVETSHFAIFLNREGNFEFGKFERWFAATGEVQTVPPESRAHIMLAVGPIVNDAFRALEEMGHVPPACDSSKLKEQLRNSTAIDDNKAKAIDNLIEKAERLKARCQKLQSLKARLEGAEDASDIADMLRLLDEMQRLRKETEL
jgi:hypothetical protein